MSQLDLFGGEDEGYQGPTQAQTQQNRGILFDAIKRMVSVTDVELSAETGILLLQVKNIRKEFLKQRFIRWTGETKQGARVWEVRDG